MDIGPPDVLERKGALTLRSHCVQYGRPTLTYRCLPASIYPICLSKYVYGLHYLASHFLTKTWITTYQDHLSQPYTDKGYMEIAIRKSMLNEDNFEDGVIDRYLDTTYRIDYVPPYDYTPYDLLRMIVKALQIPLEEVQDPTHKLLGILQTMGPGKVGAQPDGYSVVHRKCHSQFTDTADYRRHGINTWQDESGIYANADIKQKVFPVTNPIPSNVHEDNF
ncbi:hypothetical protein UY3_12446 [Chelonia mydas]|uniref:Uncharacterized protein n=1 Tax=Chelonia mydas TaxID=8469 RepID=M7B4K4_CHEMY|nr:hypothetical protein UY3_12446 [Chelonia mydas]